MPGKTYKELQSELDAVMDRFDRSEHKDVDELVEDYEKGTQIIKELEQHLKKAETKITKATKAKK